MSNDKIKTFLEKANTLAGSAVGGAVGFLAAGPVGAAGGAVAGTAITQVMNDITSRVLSARESQRVSTAAVIAINDIKIRIENGELPREDIWNADQPSPSDADGMLEGVLLEAKNENEIKKIPFIAKIFSNAVFDPNQSIQQVNMVLKLGESLTYQQLGLIAIANNVSEYSLSSKKLEPGQEVTHEKLAVFMELFDLFRRGLLLSQPPEAQDHDLVLHMNQILPANLRLSAPGEYIHYLMHLTNYDSEDASGIAAKLS